MKVYLQDKNGDCHPVEDNLVAVQSKVLRACFKYSQSEAILPLPSIEGEILAKIIAWVYRPKPESLDLDKSEGFFVCDLLLALEFLDMPVLSQQIISWLPPMSWTSGSSPRDSSLSSLKFSVGSSS